MGLRGGEQSPQKPPGRLAYAPSSVKPYFPHLYANKRRNGRHFLYFFASPEGRTMMPEGARGLRPAAAPHGLNEW